MSSTSEDGRDDKRARRVLSELAFVAPGAVPRSESVDKLTRAASHSVPSSPLKRALSRDDIERARGAHEKDATKPRVLLLHCGGTLGMGTESFEHDASRRDDALVPVAGGKYRPLGSSKYLLDVLEMVPEMMDLARVEVEVAFSPQLVGKGKGLLPTWIGSWTLSAGWSAVVSPAESWAQEGVPVLVAVRKTTQHPGQWRRT